MPTFFRVRLIFESESPSPSEVLTLTIQARSEREAVERAIAAYEGTLRPTVESVRIEG